MTAVPHKKTAARVGGLAAALGLAATIGVGGASAADAAMDCQRPNPHVNCTTTPPTEAEQEAFRVGMQCMVPTAVAGVGGPGAAAGAAGACLWAEFLN